MPEKKTSTVSNGRVVDPVNDYLKGFSLFRPEDSEVYCIAYGSNLSEERMKKRCPKAEAFGTSVIYGYRLLHYPLHWYVMPVLRLGKALVPYKAQLLYRKLQTKKQS